MSKEQKDPTIPFGFKYHYYSISTCNYFEDYNSMGENYNILESNE